MRVSLGVMPGQCLHWDPCQPRPSWGALSHRDSRNPVQAGSLVLLLTVATGAMGSKDWREASFFISPPIPTHLQTHKALMGARELEAPKDLPHLQMG